MPDDIKTSISVNGGSEIPIDFDNPSEEAKAAIAGVVRRAHGDAGHNSGTVAADQLRLFVERIERLMEEKKGLSDDIRDVFAEARSQGYDSKTMRRMIALRKMETHVRQEQAALAETYAAALGLQYPLL